MKFKLVSKILLMAIVSSATVAAHAGTVWNEINNGDLSNDGLTPTSVMLTIGDNSVLGTTGNSGQGVDRDYFSIIVPEGTKLTALTLTNDTNVSGGASFLAMQLGSQVTVTPAGVGVENLLGYLHYGNDLINQDLLPLLTAGNLNGLASGTYSLWVQETGGAATYGLNFSVAPVPLPGAALLLSSSLMGLASVRRRRRVK